MTENLLRVEDVKELAKSMADLEFAGKKEEIRSIAFQSGIVVGIFLTLGIVAVILLIQGFT
jgi:hypothetical protein